MKKNIIINTAIFLIAFPILLTIVSVLKDHINKTFLILVLGIISLISGVVSVILFFKKYDNDDSK